MIITGGAIIEGNFTLTYPSLNTPSIEYLVVAGGGGSPQSGDGNAGIAAGGAGGMLTGTLAVVQGIPIDITVGAGGAKTCGNPSSIGAVTATGGGRGGTFTTAGLAGGSGGGGGGRSSAAGGAGIAGQGFAGGSARSGNITGNSAGGGGGGAGGVGGNGIAGTPGANTGGAGGIGRATTFICVTNATAVGVGEINGGQVYFAGGGGGMANGTGGTGALGGGGNGVSSGGSGTSLAGGNGDPRTGGGAGGGNLGATGGSGVVIIRYPDTYAGAVNTNAIPITTGNYIIYIFTTSGSIIF